MARHCGNKWRITISVDEKKMLKLSPVIKISTVQNNLRHWMTQLLGPLHLSVKTDTHIMRELTSGTYKQGKRKGCGKQFASEVYNIATITTLNSLLKGTTFPVKIQKQLTWKEISFHSCTKYITFDKTEARQDKTISL